MLRADFRLRLLLAGVLPTVLMVTTLGLFWWNWTLQTLETSLRERLEATAKQLAIASELPLFSGDLLSLQGMVDGVGAGDADLLGVAVTDRHSGMLVVHGSIGQPVGSPPRVTTWERAADAESWRLVQPVLPTPLPIDYPSGPDITAAAGGPPEPMGYVVLDVSLQRLSNARENMLLIGVLVIVIAFLLNLALMTWLARGVVKPLSRITKAVEAMGQGDLDARIEGLEGKVFQLLAKVFNRMAENVKQNQFELQQRIDLATRELRMAKLKAEQEARLDPLTGVCNRRAFMERAAEELLRARRYGTPLSLIMIDLDHFKSVNDRWGHGVGDQVLLAFVDVLKKSMRAVDVVARVGGEEFILLMTETPVDEAARVAERLRQDVMAARLRVGGDQIGWTASFGLTTLKATDDLVEAALTRADKALYQAKKAGRNRVEIEL